MNVQKDKFDSSKISNLGLFLLLGLMIALPGCAADIETVPQPIKSGSSEELGAGRIQLTWRNVPGADAYNLYVSKVPGAKRNGEKSSNVTNPHTLTGLETGATYYFVVTSLANGVESEASNEIAYVVDQ